MHKISFLDFKNTFILLIEVTEKVTEGPYEKLRQSNPSRLRRKKTNILHLLRRAGD